MDIGMQEEFENYVFEDVKANMDEWNTNSEFGCYGDKESKLKFRDKIIELRRQYAKENGLKTVMQLCPKPIDLEYPVKDFIDKYIKSERARIYEEYKPLALANVQ